MLLMVVRCCYWLLHMLLLGVTDVVSCCLLQYLCECLQWTATHPTSPDTDTDLSDNSTLYLLKAWGNLMLVLATQPKVRDRL